MLIDTHAHLTDERFGGASGIIASMAEDGLERIVTVGYDMPSSLGGLEIAEQNEAVYCAVGYHPSEMNKLQPDDFEKLLSAAKRDKCVAVGEIGLDYHYDDTDKALQTRGLLTMFELARQSGLPVIFHVRDAYEDMYRLVKENRDKFRAGGVVHCFSGSKETAKSYIDMGFHISFTGSVTFKNAVKFPEIIRALPLDRILVETDCPYLAPVPHRGETNYPKYVRCQAEKIAEILQKDYAEIERQTTQNAYALFGKMKRA